MTFLTPHGGLGWAGIKPPALHRCLVAAVAAGLIAIFAADAAAKPVGQATIPVAPAGELSRQLHRRGSVRVRARVTLKPRGGTSLSRRTTVFLRVHPGA